MTERERQRERGKEIYIHKYIHIYVHVFQFWQPTHSIWSAHRDNTDARSEVSADSDDGQACASSSSLAAFSGSSNGAMRVAMLNGTFIASASASAAQPPATSQNMKEAAEGGGGSGDGRGDQRREKVCEDLRDPPGNDVGGSSRADHRGTHTEEKECDDTKEAGKEGRGAVKEDEEYADQRDAEKEGKDLGDVSGDDAHPPPAAGGEKAENAEKEGEAGEEDKAPASERKERQSDCERHTPTEGEILEEGMQGEGMDAMEVEQVVDTGSVRHGGEDAQKDSPIRNESENTAELEAVLQSEDGSGAMEVEKEEDLAHGEEGGGGGVGWINGSAADAHAFAEEEAVDEVEGREYTESAAEQEGIAAEQEGVAEAQEGVAADSAQDCHTAGLDVVAPAPDSVAANVVVSGKEVGEGEPQDFAAAEPDTAATAKDTAATEQDAAATEQDIATAGQDVAATE